MKKLLVLILALVMCLALMAGCGNKTLFDTTYTFDRAVLTLPDGTVISGPVEEWTDYEDGDQIQVKIGGTTYLVHSSCVVLIAD